VSDTILGVLIGSGISTLGPLLQFYLSWLKEHRAEASLRRDQEERRIAEQKARRDRESELIRRNAISSVANATQFCPKDGAPDTPEWIEAIKVPHKWISLLCIRTQDRRLLSAYQNFSVYPKSYVHELLKCLSSHVDVGEQGGIQAGDALPFSLKLLISTS
jgi:hypothetical protein